MFAEMGMSLQGSLTVKVSIINIIYIMHIRDLDKLHIITCTLIITDLAFIQCAL